MRLDLNRQDICDLMLACSHLEYYHYGVDSHKWTALHDRIAEQLKALDGEGGEIRTKRIQGGLNMSHIGIPAIYRGQQLMRTMPDDVQEFYNGTDFKVAVDLAGIVWVKWFGDDWSRICEESEKDDLLDYLRYIMKAMKED